MSNDTELLHASVIKRIWKKCKEEDMDIVAFAWRIQREAERAATPSAPTAVERKPLFGEMIAQHPGLREEIAAGAVEPDEPKSLNAKIADQLRPFLKPGDKVIWREAFRWHDDNGVMPNHYDGMSIAGLADEFGYRFDWDFNMNHAAIIQGAALNASKEQP